MVWLNGPVWFGRDPIETKNFKYMRTTLLLKQHKKCECILQGIQRCDRFLADYKKTLAMDPVFPAYYKKGVKKYSAIRDRLILAYSNAMANLFEPIVEKM